MAYTPYFPYYGAAPDMLSQQKMQYQPNQQPFSQPYQQPIYQSTSTSDPIWVLGEIEAQSFPVMPGNTVTLWDKDKYTIYLKSVSAQGVPSMRILDYTERGGAQQAEKHECKCSSQYVSIEAFKALEAKFQALTDEFQSLTKTKKKAVKEESDNG